MKFPSLHKKSEHTPEKAAEVEKSKQEDGKIVETGKSTTPQPPNGTSEVQKKTEKGLYVYCIVPANSPKEYGKIGVKNDSLVYAITFKDVAAVVSEFEGGSFEKTDANVLAHQRVVHKVFEQQIEVPIRFGTIRENEEDVRQFLEEGYDKFSKQLTELTPKAGEASAIESVAPTDIIAEILSQSSASAVRIRQLADTLETVKREEYEKGAAKLPEGTAKELLAFLAKAPPGAYQTSDAATAATEQMQTLERRLDALFEEINHIKDMIAAQGDPQNVSQFKKEQDEIKEAVLGLRALQDENKVSLEEAVSQAIKEQMSKTPSAKQVMLDTVGKEEPYSQSIVFSPGSQSNMTQTVESYTWCQRCGAGLVITDRFCPHCGNYQSGT
jgi:hypothetical protein